MKAEKMGKFGNPVFISTANNHHRQQLDEYFVTDLFPVEEGGIKNIAGAVNDYQDDVAIDTRKLHGNTSSPTPGLFYAHR